MNTQQAMEAEFYSAYHEQKADKLREFIAALPAQNRHVQALQHFTRNDDYLENGFICGMICEAFRQFIGEYASLHPSTIQANSPKTERE